MCTGRQVIWLAQLLSLCALALADCVILKNWTSHVERYVQCDPRGYYGCYDATRTIETGPLIYSCSNITNVRVINAHIKTTVENIIFVKEANLGSLEPNNYSWINLTTLYMDNVNVTNMVPGFFNKFPDLQSLDLTNNRYLEFIVDGVFSSLSKLDKLNLSANAIKSVTDHSFSGLINLKILDLSNNKLTTVPQNIFNYQPFLQYVNFSQNHLVNVNYAFTLPRAKMINLSRNKLGEFDFKQLEASFELNMVDLSENDIENVTNLNYTSVDRLNLAFNNIKELGDLKSVVELTISHNKLQNLHKSEFNSILEHLDLGFNEISQVSAYSFQNASNLKQLHLEHNNIQVVPTDLLLSQNYLEYFNISHNKITQIPFGLFSSSKMLVTLDVSDNGMVLDIDALSTLTNLKKLYFKNNNIKNFEPELLLSRFKHLQYITLSDNLWNCNELAKTVHLLEMEQVVILKGNNTQTSNILGISCNDNVEAKEEVIQLNINEQNQTSDTPTLQTNNNGENDVLNSINKSISDLSTNLETFLKSQGKSVSDMSQQMKTTLYSQNNNLSLILLNLKSIFSSKPVTLPVNQSKLTSEPTVSFVSNRTTNANLFIANVVLILILCCILCHLHLNVRRLNLMQHVRQEQMQLL